MDISRKTDYALRMMASLVRTPGTVLSVRSAAEENDIPYSFARSIQHDLAAAGIISSTRGAHGGMTLAVDPSQATLLEVVEALQGPVKVSACDICGERMTKCPRMDGCSFNRIWMGAQHILEAYLASFTLEEAALGTGSTDIEDIVAALSHQLSPKAGQ